MWNLNSSKSYPNPNYVTMMPTKPGRFGCHVPLKGSEVPLTHTQLAR